MSDDIKQQALGFVREHPICHLCTVEDGKPYVRVMYCPHTDDDFTIWFSTSGKSNKARHIKSNPNVSVSFFHEGVSSKFMGTAAIIDDAAKKEELWEDDWARYWPGGFTDPDYILLKITPDSGDYFDLKSGGTQETSLI